ncbi:hypothetical protein KR026_011231 [Drosophila bipectinata]|nr:hypothetical protein KR026_011231 [Drosophila bipectinata]
MRLRKFWMALAVSVYFYCLELCQGANILGVFPYRLPSHFQVVRPLVKELSNRGHNLSIITPVGIYADIEGVRHIRVHNLNRMSKDLLDSNIFLDFFPNKWAEAYWTASMLSNVSKSVLSDEGVQMLLHDKNERFDMVMVEAGHLDALYGFADHFNATLMGLSCVIPNWNVDLLAGNPAPSVYEPIMPREYKYEISVMGRFSNWIYITEEKLLSSLVLRTAQQKLFNKYFSHSSKELSDLRNQFSVILINNHFSMGRVRANVPNIIEVAGIHLSEPPEPCDEDLRRFLDEAEHGVIYFSLGMDVLVKFLPKSIQQMLLESFTQLKQRVVVRSDVSPTPNNSGNIYVVSHAPQRAVLEHPNVRLFITHGGMLSVMEAIYSGVPILGIPFFFDQFGNVHRVQNAGMAKVLDNNALSVDILTSSIQELIENPKYALKAKEMSFSFRDRPMSPLETAVWWTEYALRNEDIRYIRLNEDEFPFVQYYGLESLVSWGLRFGFVIGSLFLLVLKIYKKSSHRQRQVLKKESSNLYTK